MKKAQWLLLILLLLFIPFSSSIDLFVTDFFYRNGFYLENSPFFLFFYRYGEYPGLFVAGFSLVAFCLSFFLHALKSYRCITLYLCLLLLLGAGLIINAGLKDHWGRPRPKQTDRYGGEAPFQPFYKPNFDHPEYKSFPSGHVAMGFYFYSLVVIGRTRKNKPLLYFGSAVTSLLGGALALTRIAQGGHYFSDTLFAALIMILCAESLSLLLNETS